MQYRIAVFTSAIRNSAMLTAQKVQVAGNSNIRSISIKEIKYIIMEFFPISVSDVCNSFGNYTLWKNT